MELRNAETEVDNMYNAYKDLRQRKVDPAILLDTTTTEPCFCRDYMPEINPLSIEAHHEQKEEMKDDDEDSEGSMVIVPMDGIDEQQPQQIVGIEEVECKGISAQELRKGLDSLHSRMKELHPLTEKFRDRMNKKDPVTGAPRYGEKTMSRVKSLLHIYDQLQSALGLIYSTNSNDTVSSTSSDFLGKLQQFIELEKQQLEREALQEQRRQEQAAAQKEQRRQQEEQDRIAKEKALIQKQEEDRIELARQAREAKEAKCLAELQERERDKAYVDSIPKGKDGIQLQLNRMKESAGGTGSSEYKVAMTSLKTIFTQITKSPEQIQYRKIRMDHPQFLSDIGRHDGGSEVLIAAGFTIEKLDKIKCYFTKEPDLESDMDGWSAWFDSMKLALQVIEDEMS